MTTILGVVGLSLALLPSIVASASSSSVASSCPWIQQSQSHGVKDSVLASEVAARMTTSELVNFVVVSAKGPIENINVGVPRLCVPALTLTDGPNGVAGNLTGVTQFPSEISVAATFNPSTAKIVGRAMGQEALTKGFDVLQGPDLNLVRSPMSGRAFETYGEDPYLASAMGVAAIEGIQSTGVMAQAKHLGAYTQENARARLDQVVSARSMAEIYDAPFAAAVRTAHVASIMCAMGSVNGVNTCSSPSIYATLKAWGFAGFVRSDYAAVELPAPAFNAGMSLIKPASAAQISALVSQRSLHVAALRRAVTAVLTEMFAFGLISAHPRTLRLGAVATSPAHENVALAAARQSIVLLQNNADVLPLAQNLPSLAVIGVDAYDAVTTRGGGSSGVHASKLGTPLAALRSQLPRTRITYSPGGLPGLEFDPLNASDITAGKAPPSEVPITSPGEAGKGDIAIDYAKAVTPAALTATTPGTGEGWSSWDVTFVAKRTGTYVLGMEDIGDTWLTLNGAPVMADRGIHGPYPLSTSVQLTAGKSYTVQARWFALDAKVTPRFGIDFVQPQINAAVSAAKKARVAVVFASNLLTEGADMPSLSLQGDLDALIEAVAAVNPRTVVVLNTGGPVLTPWRAKVEGVVEAWYPGEQGGQAIAQVLTGAVDATGRLPLTMPASAQASVAAAVTQFPGQHGVVNFGALNDIGYRWYQSNQVAAAYPFGYGLSYSAYRWSHTQVTRTSKGVRVTLDVLNAGRRAGSDVVEVYVAYPPAAGEPPEQLRGFAKVQLAPGATRHVVIDLPTSDFTFAGARTMLLAPGAYTVSVGTSCVNLVASQTVQLK